MSASDYTLTPEQEAEIYGTDRITVLSPDGENAFNLTE